MHHVANHTARNGAKQTSEEAFKLMQRSNYKVYVPNVPCEHNGEHNELLQGGLHLHQLYEVLEYSGKQEKDSQRYILTSHPLY